MAGIQECENCHAPLPLGAPGAVVACAYCRAENRIAGATGVMPAHPSSGHGAPHGYGPPPSPYGAPARGYGPPSPYVPMAVPVRQPSSPAALLVAVAVGLVLVLSCGAGMAMWFLAARGGP